MAKLVFGMNQSLDGYVDHLVFAPSPALDGLFIGATERGCRKMLTDRAPLDRKPD